jgi:hypothetical protein
MTRKMPKVKGGSSSTAPKPDYIKEGEVSRPAPKERGAGGEVDPVFKKLKKIFGE